MLEYSNNQARRGNHGHSRHEHNNASIHLTALVILSRTYWYAYIAEGIVDFHAKNTHPAASSHRSYL